MRAEPQVMALVDLIEMQTLARTGARADRPAGVRARTARAPVLIAAAGGAAGIVLAFTSHGFLWQDEYAHLLFSRWFFTQPELAVDLWGRPLATLAYVLPSFAGVWAARLLTVAFAMLAVLWTARAAERRGSSGAVAALAAIAQPVFFVFSFGALPGTLFAMLFARFLLEEARARPGRAALVAALLPLARVEGVLIVAVYAIALLRRREHRLAIVPMVGLGVWNLAGWAVTGSMLFLLTANPYPAVGSIYPTAGYPYLARVLPVAAGAAVLVLAQVGIAATLRRARVEHAIAAVSAVFLILVWGVPLFASTPTPVYLIGFAPLLGVFAAEGWRWLGENRHRWNLVAALVLLQGVAFVPHRAFPEAVRAIAAPVGGRERVALAAGFALIALALAAGARSARGRRILAAGLLAAGALHLGTVVRPVPASPHERVAVEAAAWLRAHAADRPVSAVAPDLAWHAGFDPFLGWEPGSLPAGADDLDALPAGALVAWDSEFSPREGATALEDLRARGWQPVASFTDGGAEIHILERR